ncbi:hypothetical protein WSK_2239 [Novosphingobium sp. Rr 2-17]|uniref:hypothetical protein n=1 Tax=Novosphingobium sp. Rr 2-17 TaxID=555793 RepID=UPI0002699877|nr:hypothetical protein [Novosphingobium sp. Rr 2-17]EIZ79052.1 hypothetical protein WSK_2239 [Novosphingobium sp. Rr 2-17]
MKVAHSPNTLSDGEAQSRAGYGEGAVASADGEQQPIDWQALRARLFEGRELEAAHDQYETPERMRLRLRGSFDGCAASVLTTYEEVSRSVNLDTSAYGKHAEGKVSPVADETNPRERGQ